MPPRKPLPQPPKSTYADRLRYARWVRYLTAVDADETDTALATRAGVKQSWFSKWKDAADAPPGHKELLPLANALGVQWEWLAGHAGARPPLSGLWRDWHWARNGEPISGSDPYYTEGWSRREGRVPLRPAKVTVVSGERGTKRNAPRTSEGGGASS